MTTHDITIEFSKEEFDILNNALNEICHGLPIPRKEFELQVGCAEERANVLLEKIHHHTAKTIDLSRNEIAVIASALSIISGAFGAEEFIIRVGYPEEQVNQLLNRVRQIDAP